MPEKRTGLKARAAVHTGLRQTKTGTQLRSISNQFQTFPYEMPFNVSGGGFLRTGCAHTPILEERPSTIGRPRAAGHVVRGEPGFVPMCSTGKQVTVQDQNNSASPFFFVWWEHLHVLMWHSVILITQVGITTLKQT